MFGCLSLLSADFLALDSTSWRLPSVCGAWNALDATGAAAAVGPGTAPRIAKRQTGLATAGNAGAEL